MTSTDRPPRVEHLDALVADLPDGDRALVIGPSIRDCAPTEAKEGAARRRVVNTGGTCPCGARLRLPNRAARRAARRAGRVLHTEVRHATDCPAVAS